eukprot:TRINITY_DN3409_c0_g1_i3.p1 TRINITY_DN3409_c0_g1~~TRINITY_DN3409_c0_g1_i3.p1  ORF type:complete len:1639 (+),score=222.45 TRINITY_DN3409_c0_g1_i3:43-4959(+)
MMRSPFFFLQALCMQPSCFSVVWCLFNDVSACEAFLYDFSLRVARLFGGLLHEYAHLLAAVVLSSPKHGIFTLANCMGNVSLHRHLIQLCPGVPHTCCTCVVLPQCKCKSEAACVAGAGLLVSVLILMFGPCEFDSPIFVAAMLNLFAALCSDASVLFTGALPFRAAFGCGNWGLLCPLDSSESKSLFPPVLAQVLTGVLDVVELRGAQAGGVNTFVESAGWSKRGSYGPTPVVTKIVKQKRGMLASVLFKQLRGKLSRLQWRNLGALRPMPVVLAQGHSRFGTSSAPAVNETHPHQWEGTSLELIWSFDEDDASWKARTINYGITITHNGDFDAWQPYEDVVSNGELGLWLERVLHCKNTARGDSPKLCGLFDLLVTKGSWFRSVRLAFTLQVMTHVEQVSEWEPLSKAAPNSMPKKSIMREWAQTFHDAFKHYLLLDHTPQKVYEPARVGDEAEPAEEEHLGIVMPELMCTVEKFLIRLCASEAGQLLNQMAPEGSKLRETFVASTLSNFFNMDVFNAASHFFSHATGTFGISVSCSAEPSKCVLAARGQPISIGFDPAKGLVLWSSEPVSLATRWPGEGPPRLAATLRLDLQDKVGEIMEVQVVEKHIQKAFHTQASLFANVKAAFLPVISSSTDSQMIQRPKFTILLRSCSMTDASDVLDTSMLASRLVALQFAAVDSPLKALSPSSPSLSRRRQHMDPIESDIADIPMVLRTIDRTWADENSLNYQSSLDFGELLLQRARTPKPADHQEIDLLVTGVETSHWLGQQFVADISRSFPNLRVVALSSNFVLGVLQEGQGRVEPLGFPLGRGTFTLARGAVCLAISQSGTTYPTVWAARLLKALGHVHVFGLSGHFDTVLGASLGQSMSEVSFNRRLFSSMAGVRPSEPSTVATAALHHTLSHLLLTCMRLDVESADRTLPSRCVADLSRCLQSLAISAESICGVDADGIAVQSNANVQLLSMGDKWASHLTEGYWATFWGALYVLVTVIAGIPPVTSFWLMVPALEVVPAWVPRTFDALIYVFLAALISVLHRLLTGRRLWTRYTARTVVIVDTCTSNYKCLRAYVSKLRALAFRFTTFGVAGQNPTDHFVHEMTHLTTSETLIAVGRPDGRMASLAATEAATIMSMQQAKFIKQRRTGIEAFSIGHNPWSNPRLFTQHIALPQSARPVFMSEVMLHDLQEDPERRFAGCHPEECLHKFAALRDGARSNRPQVPKLSLAMLKDHLGRRTSISKAEARELIRDILEEQQEELGIRADDIPILELLPIKECERFTVRKAGRRGSFSGRGGEESGRRNSFSSCVGEESPIAKGKDDITVESSNGEMESPQPVRRLSSVFRGHAKQNISTGTPKSNMAHISLTGILTLIRSAEMRRLIHVAHRKAQKEQFMRRLSVQALVEFPEILHVAFMKWKGLIEVAPRTPVNKVHHPGDWRQLEAYRAAVIANPLSMLAWGASLSAIFRMWRNLSLRSDAVRTRYHVVGFENGNFLDAASTLDNQALHEHFYETRVAAHERLIAFFVLFHRMVKPISRVPFLGFDMDRTESRLRVASTPAPVAMRERLKDDDNDLTSGDVAPALSSFPRICDSTLPAENSYSDGYVAKPEAVRDYAGHGCLNEGRPHVTIDCRPGVASASDRFML